LGSFPIFERRWQTSSHNVVSMTLFY
jgi:hypothetical protein